MPPGAPRSVNSARTADHIEGTNRVFPVPIDDSAYRLRTLFSRNRLPAGPPRPSELPERPQSEAEHRVYRERVERRARILRRAVTEAATRELRKQDPDQDPERLSVFVSHAKRDGTPIATAIRDGLADFGQLTAWFDANDLPPGHGFAHRMTEAAKNKTAALISVVTDAYPTRPWCRYEVQQARTPRPLDLPHDGHGRIKAWTVQPSVAISSNRTNWSRPMAQLAQVPHLGWGHAPQTKERIEDVVDRLLLEILLVNFYREYAPNLADYLIKAQPDRRVALLTWVPDPWSIAKVWRSMPERSEQWTIAYPGHGLRTAERSELESLIADLNNHEQASPNRWRLLSQERLLQSPDAKPRPGIRVALSTGGQPADIERAGVAVKVIDDLLIRMTRRLVEAHVQVRFGGRTADHRSPLSEGLLEVAQGWDAAYYGINSDVTNSLDVPPIVNYVAWPYHRSVYVRTRAELAGICEFQLIDRMSGDDEILFPDPNTFDPDNDQHRRCAAYARTEMRQRMSEDSDVRIILGGKTFHFGSWVPSVVEDATSALERKKLPLIIGGFGGSAATLADFLQNPHADWPGQLTLMRAREADPAYRNLTDAARERKKAEDRFDAAKEILTTYRRQLHGPIDQWPTTWSDREAVKELLLTKSFSPCIKLVLQILEKLGSA